ncbi:hypothetical protein O181_083010 [Austropuccinia psidii MF-1]|uniref:Uncharacterized protein n=1 Tax=Austropuccinia psidii MF-1 TaxID=1389203 RepID=A0A9Q3ILB5_9BASI|nr:hypothetical protein [Austropuccinia psidii MF-1]
MIKALAKSVEESNKNNSKSQMLANKLISASEKMSHRVNSGLMRMESMKKNMSTQDEKIAALKNEKQVKDTPGFIKKFLKIDQLKNKAKDKKTWTLPQKLPKPLNNPTVKQSKHQIESLTHYLPFLNLSKSTDSNWFMLPYGQKLEHPNLSRTYQLTQSNQGLIK